MVAAVTNVDRTMRQILDALSSKDFDDTDDLATAIPECSERTFERSFNELMRLGLVEGKRHLGGVAEPRLTTWAVGLLEAKMDPFIPTARSPSFNVVQHISHSSIAGNVAAGTNIVQRSRGDARGPDVFQELRQTIEARIDDHARREQLHAAVNQMESAAGTNDFASTYKAFIAFAADHLQIFSAILPALSQLL